MAKYTGMLAILFYAGITLDGTATGSAYYYHSILCRPVIKTTRI